MYQDSVAILLCTFFGQAFLEAQLDSITTQSHTNWTVWASDDGSQDRTRTILESYKQNWEKDRLSIQAGPNKGYVANFLSLTCNADIQADFYAYSDQDDVWETDKLESAIRRLKSVPETTPALYCSRTTLIDEKNNFIGYSPLFLKPASFANALMQNIAGGNTMVFNNAARKLLQHAGAKLDIVSHDWWVYLVVTGCGGKVFYERKPSVKYRQHTTNLIGKNSNWSARIHRTRLLYRGHFSDWNARHISALRKIYPLLTDENQRTLQDFETARLSGLIPRVKYFKRSGIYRQTMPGNLGLLAAVLLNKI